MDYSVDAIVIGAGVVGLAVARELVRAGHETVLLERADAIGTESSSRNSEVIHAGIYYPPNSLKARLCVRGKELLYRYAQEHRVDHRQSGKLIVACSDAEVARLSEIQARAEAAGVHDLRAVDSAEALELEPEVRAVAGVYSPSTGIVDSHQLMLALQGEFEAGGGMIAFHSEVAGGRLAVNDGHVLQVRGEEDTEIGCRILVNAAGLAANAVWEQLRGDRATEFRPQQYYAKGHYYSYSGRAPFSRPVYPVPEDGGLGIHATPDLGGQIRFGPDVRWVDDVDYSFDDSARDAFADAIRRYYPALDDERLQPGYTGIRTKLAGPGTVSDFVLHSEAQSGIANYVGLHGIESPGLTASLAIAEVVAQALQREAD